MNVGSFLHLAGHEPGNAGPNGTGNAGEQASRLVAVDAHDARLDNAAHRIDVDGEVVTADAVEALGDRAAPSRDVSGNARVRKGVIRMDVAVERDVDASFGEFGEK